MRRSVAADDEDFDSDDTNAAHAMSLTEALEQASREWLEENAGVLTPEGGYRSYLVPTEELGNMAAEVATKLTMVGYGRR
jgi:hypothetical protein